MIVFNPLQQELLTGRYLRRDPGGLARRSRPVLTPERISGANLERARALAAIAEQWGQRLAQLALQWVLRDRRVASALIGASSLAQVEGNVAALQAPALTDNELAVIEAHAGEGTGR